MLAKLFLKKKNMKKSEFFASLNKLKLKKGVRSGVGSGLDPDPHQNVTDPHHWL
jgi:hypothetical protein